MGGANRGHYHNRYNNPIDNDTMKRYCQNFVLSIGQASLQGITTYSCSSVSELNKVIKYVPFNDIVSWDKMHKEEPQPSVTAEPEKEMNTLSILICTLYSRKAHLQKLLQVLRPQYKQKFPDKVEVLIEVDNGKMSIGAKRNLLLRAAQGDYVCFIDDDDMVAVDYVDKIMLAIQSDADCCSLIGEIHQKRKRRRRKFIHSIKYNKWFEQNGVYYRCPNHLNAIRRELALKVLFPEIDKGEDRDFSMRLLPLLQNEAQIEGTLYYYEAS